MNPNMAYYALETKIATKKGRILNKNDWNKFLDSNSVEQLTDLLKSNDEYGKAFNNISAENIDRNNLETILVKFRTLEIENLLHYFAGPYKEFIKSFLMESEIEDIILIIRKISRGESLEGIEEKLIHSKIHSNISYENLINSNNIEQVIEKLKGTPYYKGLKNLTKEDAITREFHIEMKMYLVMYNTLLEKATKLKKDDMLAAKELIGLKIDLLNIQWIYRAKKYYQISPEEIFMYSLEEGKSLGYKHLNKLVNSKDDEFKNLTRDYLKFDLFKELKDSDFNIEINSYLLNYLKKNSYKNVGIVLSFIFLLDIIINDVTSIIEGIQYNVPREELKGYLAYKL